MHRAAGATSAEDARHRALDVRALDLDVDCGAIPDERQHIRERRYPVTAPREGNFPYLGERGQRDLETLPAVGSDVGVMVYHDDTVRGRVDIQLDPISAKLERQLERGEGVLAAEARGAAMSDQLGHRVAPDSGVWISFPRPTGRRNSGRVRQPTALPGKALTSTALWRLPPRAAMAEAAEEHDPADEALIAGWLGGGDQRAATLLVERHAPALARFVRSLGAREDADELVQDTFVKAFAALDSFRSDSSFRTWLFTIGKRLLLDRRRAGKRRGTEVGVSEDDAVTAFDALDSLVADETAVQLRGVVEKLSPTQREVFTLRVVEGLSYKEIADVVGTTEGAARVHYHNAMRTVKETIGD